MYTPLNIKTEYTFLSSLIKIDKLVKKCTEYNITSIAICDNHLFGAIEFYKKCKQNGINPIIGLDITIEDSHIFIYAKNYHGYQNLLKLETITSDRNITIEDIKTYKEETVIVVPAKHIENLKEQLKDLKICIGIENKEEEKRYSKYFTVYIKEILFLEKYEYKYMPYILMIRDGKTINDGISFDLKKNYLETFDELSKNISYKTIENTNKLASTCQLEMPKDQLFMPKYSNKENIPSKDYLTSLCIKGLKRRLQNNVTDIYQKRLNYELKIIIKMHFEDYFLVVYDYIKWAKQNGILVGPGRGSAAGSLVAYSLGITEVDPIKYNLLFERFLNPERISMPDIDTDFPDNQRDQVIKYVTNKYGDKNVAGIITYGTLGAKQAVRDVGRVLKIPTATLDEICKKLGFKDTLPNLIKKDQSIKNLLGSSTKLKLLYNLVNILMNHKRHHSSHAAGIVISYKPLDEIVPIIKNDGMYLTEFSMQYLEELGLIKMDFLGLTNLSIIKQIIDDIRKDKNININFNNIPLDDNRVISIFKKADTMGIFQFESDGMRNFLRQLKPETLEDIFAAIALFRPGPAKNIPTYIDRKNNKKPFKYLDDTLKDILKPTYGIMIYQEQIILIANKMANYSLGEADILRKAMSKKQYNILKNEETKFVNQSIKNGYQEEKAREIFNLILEFANYGFNRSHSVSYSLIAYKMAYLKYYFPKYFYKGILSGNHSSTKANIYINEMKRKDIKLLPPSVNISTNNYQVVEDGIIAPLKAIRNIGQTIANDIIKEREEHGKYKNIFDFLKRTYEKTNNKKVLESLIFSSSLDCFNLNKKTLIENLETITNYVELMLDLQTDQIVSPEIITYDEYDDDYLSEYEKKLFGFYIKTHKTEKYKLKEKNITDISDFPNHFNKKVNIIITIDRKKQITTKKNEQMLFIDGSDNTGSTTVVIFPKYYNEKIDKNLEKGNIIKIKGQVEKRFDQYQIIAEEIKPL